MSSYKRPQVFDPLDLQIIDLVYEAAWAQFTARDPRRDTGKDEDRQELLRKKVFAVATPGEVEFDTLLDRVLASIPGLDNRGQRNDTIRDRPTNDKRRQRPGL